MQTAISPSSELSWQPYRHLLAYLDVPASLRPPLWRERRARRELAAVRSHPLMTAGPCVHGDGRPLLLVPGFLSGTTTARLLGGWLARQGFAVTAAGHGRNADCGERDVARVVERLERAAEEAGGPVTVVGHSRGGQLARVVAVRRPALVRRVVTLASPLTDPFAIHLAVRGASLGLAALARLGVPDLVQSCPVGDCCRTFHDDLLGPFPTGVPFTSVYSRSDGIVDWVACLDPAAEHVEIDASHSGMIASIASYEALAKILATRQ